MPFVSRSHALSRGPRVRLRLAQARDRRSIELLLARHGEPREPLELARLTRIDPRRRVVICATALVDGAETLIGVAAMDVGARQPELVCVDRDLTDGLDELLGQALAARAEAIASRQAA